MSKLDGLKIKECPYAFASFAEKHNQLVDMLAGMVGQNGITVVVSERNAIIRGNIANATGGGGTITGNVANVVGSDGRLQNAYVGNSIANAWPTTLKTVNPAGNVVLDNVGLTTFKAAVLTASGNVTIDSTGLSMVTSGGKYCNVAFASITQNISIQNIKVCDNGNTKHMLVLGSAAF